MWEINAMGGYIFYLGFISVYFKLELKKNISDAILDIVEVRKVYGYFSHKFFIV